MNNCNTTKNCPNENQHLNWSLAQNVNTAHASLTKNLLEQF